MMNCIRNAISRFVPKIWIFAFISIFALMAASSQSSPSNQNRNFPSGSIQGRTEMDRNLRPIAVPDIPNVDISITQPQTGSEIAFSLQVLLLLTILTVAPSLLILLTCFLRFSIVLDFIKRALSLQQVPPTAVLNGIAFFMTIFVMWPVFDQIYTESFQPLSRNEITLDEAYTNAKAPIKIFLYKQCGQNPEYIARFMNMVNAPSPQTLDDVPMYVIIPAYILHELTVAFKIGVILYIPFIVIDMVVASILMSMGMMMLPPVQISMPFKLMLFVLVDGWGLLTQQLFNSVVR